MQKTDYLGAKPRRMALGSLDYVNVICLRCRKAGNHLPCSHPKIRTKKLRVPRKGASRKQWANFVKYLNHPNVWVSDERGKECPKPIVLP